ncbi:MAG: glycosyltransferase family 2 protein [Candidatus Methylomirabilia bacterium]
MPEQRIGPISLVILAHNEAEVIEQVVRDYHAEVISRLPGSEFIIVEDGSRDRTWEILQGLRGELGLTVIHREERRGYTAALKEALSLPKHDVIFFSDSDGQHDPRDFWRLAKRIPYCDLVIGFKQPRRDPLYRLLMSRVFNILIGFVFKLRLRDINCGFRLMRRELVDELVRDDWQMKACIATELSIRAFYKGYRIDEVPVRHRPRPFGESRGLPLRQIPRSVIHVLREFVIMRRKIKAGTF